MKVSLCLSGGGIKGAAHSGVLKAFEESGVCVESIGGTSSGSIVLFYMLLDLMQMRYITYLKNMQKR